MMVATGGISLRMVFDRSVTGFMKQVEIFNFVFDLFEFTSGASSPDCIQPTDERGGVLLCYVFCFLFFFFPSSVSSSYSSPPWLGAVKIFSPTNLRLPHHIPLITAPSLRWSLAMGMIDTKTIINFSFLRQI
jgi:hypothetical protein